MKENESKSKYQKFIIETWNRSDIKNAEYNPRIISDEARKRLSKSLKKHGLIQPIIVNRLTGNIVGGHKRLEQLEIIEKSNTYLIDVAIVEMTEKQEKEANIQLNNDLAMGEWDTKLLNDLFVNDKLDLDNTGFDLDSINVLGIDFKYDFPEEIESVKKDLKEANDIKDIKKKIKNDMESNYIENDSPNFFLVVVFLNEQEKDEWLKSKKLRKDTKYIDSEILDDLYK